MLIVKLILIILIYIVRIYENEFEEFYGMSYKWGYFILVVGLRIYYEREKNFLNFGNEENEYILVKYV